MAGVVLSLLLCLIGVFGMEPGTPESGSMAIWAVVVLMFTMAIVLKWSRCPWCGELIIKKLFSIVGPWRSVWMELNGKCRIL